MTPDIGSVCYFTFQSNFQLLNGIYKVQAETSFEQSVKAGIDFTESLYRPAGLAEGDYLADLDRIKKSGVLVLESVKDQTVYYIPSALLATVPDPTIREYFPLSVVLSLGIYRNTQQILPFLDEVKDLVETLLGVTDGMQVVTNTKNKQYLTDAQYAVLEEARSERKKQLSPVRLQLQESERKNLQLQNKVAYYENLLIQLGQPS